MKHDDDENLDRITYAEIWKLIHAWRRRGDSDGEITTIERITALVRDVPGPEFGGSLRATLLDVRAITDSKRPAVNKIERVLRRFKARLLIPETVLRGHVRDPGPITWDGLIALEKNCPRRRSDVPVTLDVRDWEVTIDGLRRAEVFDDQVGRLLGWDQEEKAS